MQFSRISDCHEGPLVGNVGGWPFTTQVIDTQCPVSTSGCQTNTLRASLFGIGARCFYYASCYLWRRDEPQWARLAVARCKDSRYGWIVHGGLLSTEWPRLGAVKARISALVDAESRCAPRVDSKLSVVKWMHTEYPYPLEQSHPVAIEQRRRRQSQSSNYYGAAICAWLSSTRSRCYARNIL